MLSTAVVSSVVPETGTALIFSHHILHQGSAVVPLPNASTCEKWLLRTDAMFERKQGSAKTLTENQKTAISFLSQAKCLEAEGKLDQAVAKYKAAFKLYPELEETC